MRRRIDTLYSGFMAKKGSILICDDEEIMRDVLETILSGAGYKVDLAKNKKASYMERYGRPGSEKGWHFLTGTQASIDKVTQAAGFSYKWDEKSNQFAHAGGIMVLTPDGKLSRYLYGIDYAPKDLKFGIMESSASKIGNPAEQLLLYCYHYDPSTGKYGLAILRVMRLGAIATLLGVGAMVFVLWRRNKRKTVNSDEVK